MSEIMRFIGITKDALTAGPGKRLELFTKGCIRGVVSPCQGCFNQITWSFEGKYREMNLQEVIEVIELSAWNNQVTFCGGEPILQGKAIASVAKQLKEKDPSYHIVMYTMYKLDVLKRMGLGFTWSKKRHEAAMLSQLMDYADSYEILNKDDAGNPTLVRFQLLTPDDIQELMTYIDIIVDGEYKHDQRLTIAEYMHDGGFIGSANQRVIFAAETIRRKKEKLVFYYADEFMAIFDNSKHCISCGTMIYKKGYCSDRCKNNHELHIKETSIANV